MPLIKSDFTKLFREVNKKTSKKDHKTILKELRKLDPNTFKKMNIRKKLTPQQKGAISKKLAKHIDELRGRSGMDLYRPPKKKGESQLAYTRRLNKTMKKNGQKGNLFKGVYIENPDQIPKRYTIDKEGNISTSFKNSRGDKIVSFVVPSSAFDEFNPERNEIMSDINTALKKARKLKLNKELSDISLSVENRLSFTGVPLIDLANVFDKNDFIDDILFSLRDKYQGALSYSGFIVRGEK